MMVVFPELFGLVHLEDGRVEWRCLIQPLVLQLGEVALLAREISYIAWTHLA